MFSLHRGTQDLFSCGLWDLGLRWGSAVENPPAHVGDLGSIPGSGRSLDEEMATHSSVLAWEIPWTEEPQGLQSTGLQKSQTQLGHSATTCGI